MTKRANVAEARLVGPNACFEAIQVWNKPRIPVLISSYAFGDILYFFFVNILSLSCAFSFNDTHVPFEFAFSDN